MAISVENRNFSHPRVFDAPAAGFPLQFLRAVGLRKLEWYSRMLKSRRYVHSFRRDTDIGQRDGIGKTMSRSACIAS